MKLKLATLAFALVLSGCAEHAARDRLGIEDATVVKAGLGASQDSAAGAVTQQWITAYAPAMNSKAALAALQQRLDNTPGDKASYFHAKAQCWIDAARQTSAAHDHWGFVEEAIGQAATITIGLEKSAPPTAANPVLRTVSTVRPDLWQIVNAIKSDPAIAQCLPAQQSLACAEVELMQAGHDAWARRFISAERRLAGIKDNLRKSAETAAQCVQVKPQVAASAMPPRKITVRADSLFRFNGGREDAILPAGKAQLDAIARELEQAPGIGEVMVTGFTDRLGSASYNEKLSLQRAETVKRYLRDGGVTLPISAKGLGRANQVVACEQKERHELVRCLAPNRRVEIELIRRAS